MTRVGRRLSDAQWRRLARATLGGEEPRSKRGAIGAFLGLMLASAPLSLRAVYLGKGTPQATDVETSLETEMKMAHQELINASAATLILMVASAHGADLRIPSQYPTLSAAVAASAPGDRILIGPGTYPWESVALGHSLTIESTHGPLSTRFLGNGSETGYLLNCNPGSSGVVTLRGLHVDRGRGIRFQSGRFILESSLFTGNVQGFHLEDSGAFVEGSVSRCAFVENGGAGVPQGGGLRLETGPRSVGISDCLFLMNRAGEGGGLHLAGSLASIQRSIFYGNQATQYSGGAIARWWSNPTVSISNSTFESNTAAWSGTGNWNCCISCTGCSFDLAEDPTIDCDGDGIVDIAERTVNPSVDADGNGVIDSCEVVNLVANGGLEGSTPAACGFLTLGSGSTTIPGWQVNGANSVDWNWAHTKGPCCDLSPEGDRTVDLNGSPAQNGSAIRQTVATVVGTRYRISLLARANECCSSVGTTKTLRVTAGDSVSEHVLVVDGLQGCDISQWTRIERSWTATSAQSVIELRSLVPSSAGGPIVDDVSVVVAICPGDVDDSGSVGPIDLAIVLAAWGTLKYPGADANGDGIVDALDLSIVLAGWGACP